MRTWQSSKIVFGLLFIAELAYLSACAVEPPAAPEIVASTPVPSPTSTPTLIPTSPPTPAFTSPPPAATPTLGLALCSPLEGVALAEVPGMVVNPYSPPRLGSDDPHQGVDLADRLGGDGMALPGKPVHAVMAGEVAGVIPGRFPYGNAVMVETPLEALPRDTVLSLDLPEAIPTLPVIALTCPDDVTLPAPDAPGRSLYLLYAHMQAEPQLRLGDRVACGHVLGAIGDSGNALNPHLHLEARLGPSGMRFPVMAHYDSRATPEEMAYYCLWRVSGAFLVIDPLRVLNGVP